MRARDHDSIFSIGRKFHPDYGLLLELQALTLVARSYALLTALIARPQATPRFYPAAVEKNLGVAWGQGYCSHSDSFSLRIGSLNFNLPHQYICSYTTLSIHPNGQCLASIMMRHTCKLRSYKSCAGRNEDTCTHTHCTT